MKQSELLQKKINKKKTEAYWNGSFIDFNGLDVKNLKHPVFDK